jgi:hypothetical protein
MAEPEALNVAEIFPHRLLLLVQPTPESTQVTPLFCKSFCTVAVNVCVVATARLTVAGDTVNRTDGTGPSVIAAAADLVRSVTDVAVSVTLLGVGAVIGAV